MAPRAGFWDIQAINRRLGIPIVQKRMGLSVAIHASRRRDPRPNRDTVVGRLVDLSFKDMTIRALDRRGLILMRDLANVCMTGSAKIFTVNRTGVLRRIDLTMAGKAILVLDFLGSAEGPWTKDGAQHKTKEKNGEYFQKCSPREEKIQRGV